MEFFTQLNLDEIRIVDALYMLHTVHLNMLREENKPVLLIDLELAAFLLNLNQERLNFIKIVHGAFLADLLSFLPELEEMYRWYNPSLDLSNEDDDDDDEDEIDGLNPHELAEYLFTCVHDDPDCDCNNGGVQGFQFLDN